MWLLHLRQKCSVSGGSGVSVCLLHMHDFDFSSSLFWNWLESMWSLHLQQYRNLFRSCHLWVLACFWICCAWRMNRQRFIVHDIYFLAIIRLNGFTIWHFERGVVGWCNKLYQSVRLLHLTNADSSALLRSLDKEKAKFLPRRITRSKFDPCVWIVWNCKFIESKTNCFFLRVASGRYDLTRHLPHLHCFLCDSFQWDFWQSLPQYFTALHLEHCRMPTFKHPEFAHGGILVWNLRQHVWLQLDWCLFGTNYLFGSFFVPALPQ